MERLITKPDNEEHWLQMREANLNSTDASCLYGANPYQSEFELYHQKKGNIESQFTETERVIIGRHVERGIAKAFQQVTGWKCVQYKPYITIPELRIGSSYDFIIRSGPYKHWLLEIKNVDFLIFRDQWVVEGEGDGEAPLHIEIQAMHEALVADAPGVIILACVGGNTLKWIARERDQAMCDAMLERYAQFWDAVDNDREPTVDYQRDMDAIMALYNKAEVGAVYDATEDTEVSAHIANYVDWGKDIKKLEGLRSSAKAEVLQKIGEVSKVEGEDHRISCGVVKENEGKLITKDMVGQRTGMRKSFRMFRATVKTKKEDKNDG